jgi:hypothetical protein
LRDSDKFYLECKCAGETVLFEQEHDENSVNITYMVPVFYTKQKSVFENAVQVMKVIHNLIFKGEYRFYSIEIEDRKTLRRFKEFVANLKDIEDV